MTKMLKLRAAVHHSTLHGLASTCWSGLARYNNKATVFEKGNHQRCLLRLECFIMMEIPVAKPNYKVMARRDKLVFVTHLFGL